MSLLEILIVLILILPVGLRGVVVGDYNTINKNTEIRCDESVIIGSYNQISYSNRIWDTNTHRVMEKEEIKSYIKERFPLFDEIEKPKTRAVKIGDCNWFGEFVFIKSSQIENHNVIGFRTSVVNMFVDNDNMITNRLDYRISKI